MKRIKIKSIIFPSCELIFESELSQEKFIAQLASETGSSEKWFPARADKRFGGKISSDGKLQMMYGMYARGIRLSGVITKTEKGSLAHIIVGLPGWYLAFGMSLAWGIVILMTAAIIMINSSSHISILPIIKEIAMTSIPLLLIYGIMFGNVWQGAMRVEQFFEDHLKR